MSTLEGGLALGNIAAPFSSVALSYAPPTGPPTRFGSSGTPAITGETVSTENAQGTIPAGIPVFDPAIAVRACTGTMTADADRAVWRCVVDGRKCSASPPPVN